ncbi:MAG: hypothetical protein Q4G50_00230 [Corynebacterium sp.]|uniref:hypothetical protein n=1 Tax=Corynebacterium sp. TaxID=1720 RepID=UPI0026E0F06E|nr:hypothetical protein [Corynebacterium sp.]MDO5668415.1 hypothetical protein [Corynebacterium sp.]
MTQRVIAVVDKQEDVTVIWHVQTSPDAPSASGILSGAWLLGDGDVDPARLDDLLADVHIITTGSDGLERIRTAIEKQLAHYKAAAKAAKENNPQLTLPRFDAPEPIDIDLLAETYRGAPQGRLAWSYAAAAAQLVEAWHTIEGQRRSRKYLQKTFGTTTLPLPVGE